jgi:hypothetical protein
LLGEEIDGLLLEEELVEDYCQLKKSLINILVATSLLLT